MAIETHLAHSQQGTIVDFESNGERSVSRLLTRDSNARPRMALLIQSGANREGDQLKRHRIGWFSEPGSEFLVFQYFFDLFLREQPGAGILHLGKKRPLLQMKDKSYVFLVFERWTRRESWRHFFHLNGFEPTWPREGAEIFVNSRGVEWRA